MPAVTSSAKPDEDKTIEQRYAEHLKQVAQNEAKLRAQREIAAKRR